MNDEVERSESGSPIYRHAARERDWSLPRNPGEHLQEVEAHVERHIGKVELVFHELLSDLIHLDVLYVPATADRPYHTLVTSGVSDEPMKVPEGMEKFNRAELLIALPPDWPLSDKAFQNEANYWPVRWLKQIGRLPHQYSTWIGWGHTIPNGDPAEPIANTNFVGVMVAPPYWLPSEFFQLHTAGDETISFYNLVPLYQEEMELKLQKGADELEERFEAEHVGFILNTGRTNVVRKKGLFR